MVENNSEEEEKKSSSGSQVKSKISLPPKSVTDIAATLEFCCNDAAQSNINFIDYLCDQALNLQEDEVEAEKPAIELFTSDEFRDLRNLVNEWKL